MEKKKFTRWLRKAKALANLDKTDFWHGYVTGLRRRHYGEDFGDDKQHQVYLSIPIDEPDPFRRSRAAGYRAGLAGYDPVDCLKGLSLKFTTNHAASSYGVPVIVDADNSVLDYGPGIRLIRKALGLSHEALGQYCGVSGRTVQGWEQGKLPSKPVLKLLWCLLNNIPQEAMNRRP